MIAPPRFMSRSVPAVSRIAAPAGRRHHGTVLCEAPHLVLMVRNRKGMEGCLGISCHRLTTILLDKPRADLHQQRMMNHQKPLGKSSSLRLASGKNAGIRILMGCSMVLLFSTGLEAKPMVWEYRVVTVNTTPRILEATLNENGAQGWELVEITTKGVAIFKRPKGK
jgi:hypothetical protein